MKMRSGPGWFPGVIGRATVHPVLFYSGKISGYLAWLANLLTVLNIVRLGRPPFPFIKAVSFALTGFSLLIITLSLFNLGKSTRLGLPSETTEFKTGGLYRFCRNPMYAGFDLLTLSSIIITWNVAIAILGIFSIATYHIIIMGEEIFLEERFGARYLAYKKRVRRYL